VNSTPDDDAISPGAVYVFTRSAGVWAQQAYLKPAAVGPGGQNEDAFGFSVAVSDDTVVVGAPLENSNTTGVNSAPDENTMDAGAAYVFTRSAGVWTQQAYLKPAAFGTTQAGDYFGISVSVSGHTVVVGAGLEGGGATVVNGAPDENAPYAGAAYVFTHSAGVWAQQMYLKPATIGTYQDINQFGWSVSISGSTVVVGARGEASGSTGVNSTPDESAGNAGAAFVFPVSGITIQQPAGTGLVSGVSTQDYGGVIQGSAAAKTFTIGNSDAGALDITSVSTLGGNAGEFAVNTNGMLTSVPSGGSTTFTVTFTPAVASSRTTTLRILSGDLYDGTFDIALTGVGLSFTNDTDGDGMNDASESQLAALGFDWQVNQTALVNTLATNANDAGFFTVAQVQALNVDMPLLQKDPTDGLFTLTIGVQKSTNLVEFTPFPMTAPQTIINGAGKLEFQFTAPDDAAFFRLQSQ
jgi:hypothetical protein